jgi:hypothetical protein
MPWGSDLWGGIWGSTEVVVVDTSSEVLNTTQLRGFAFPLAFLPNTDFASEENAGVSRDTARNAVLVLQNAIPLSPQGTIVPLLAFEPADQITGALVAHQTAKGVAAGSKYVRVVKVEQLVLEDDSMEFRVTVQDSRLSPSDLAFHMVSGVLGWSAPIPVK